VVIDSFSEGAEIYQVRTFGVLATLRWVDSVHSPDEYPFTSNLPEPVLKPTDFPKILYANTVNANPSILSFYTRQIVPRITKTATVQLATSKRAKGITGDDEYEDDGNYGSSATLDVEVLQAISKRVHYGKFSQAVPQNHGFHKTDLVALLYFYRLRLCENNPLRIFAVSQPGKFVSESKFLSDPAAFVPHIQKPNRDALEALITKPEVERKLLQRLRKKATVYAQDLAADGSPNQDGTGKIDVDGVVELYEHYIIPLTKEVEVRARSLGHHLSV